jgi:hypothetical protein
MAVTLVPIASNTQIAQVGFDDGDPVQVLYTSTGGPTQINSITVSNKDTDQLWVAFWILPSGIAATTCPPTWTQACIAAAGSLFGTTIISGLLGQIIPSGGTLVCAAGVTNEGYVTASGIKVT